MIEDLKTEIHALMAANRSLSEINLKLHSRERRLFNALTHLIVNLEDHLTPEAHVRLKEKIKDILRDKECTFDPLLKPERS
jgi:hypothetical protein